MRWITWFIRLLIFIFILAFALKNTVRVPVTFFWGVQWEVPLVSLLLIFLIAGAILGVLAMFGRIWHLNRELARLKRQLHQETATLEDQNIMEGELIDPRL